MPVLCPSHLRGNDPLASSIPCQKQQQNMMAEVSAQPPEPLHRSIPLEKTILLPSGEKTILLPPGAVWGGPRLCTGHPPGLGSRPHLCCSCPTCSGRVAKEVMESSAKIKREPPEIHR